MILPQYAFLASLGKMTAENKNVCQTENCSIKVVSGNDLSSRTPPRRFQQLSFAGAAR